MRLTCLCCIIMTFSGVVFSVQSRAENLPETTKIGDIVIAYIPKGSFLMGSDQFSDNTKPRHAVHIDAFYMSTTEVTQGLFQTIMHENPSYTIGDSTLPVEKVSWFEAARFCNRLSDTYGLKRCYDETSWECDFSQNGFRLPTEAEWEYACRAGTNSLYYTGNTTADLAEAAWFGNIELGNCDNIPHPAGMRKPNAWGLYDMHGSQWEWCNDWYDSAYYRNNPPANPTGPDNGGLKVIRGGSWISNPEFCRADTREMYKPELNYYDIGIRLVCRPY